MKLFALNGDVFDRIPVGDEDAPCTHDDEDGTCCGCGKASGVDHDLGCDWEQCPKCRGQFLSCDCDDDEAPKYTAQEAMVIVANLSCALVDEQEASHA